MAATTPNTPAQPTTTVNGTNIIVSWALPFNGGTAITGYKIKFLQSDAITYSENTIYCDGINMLTIVNTR